jgi:hypothetical protein
MVRIGVGRVSDKFSALGTGSPNRPDPFERRGTIQPFKPLIHSEKTSIIAYGSDDGVFGVVGTHRLSRSIMLR